MNPSLPHKIIYDVGNVNYYETQSKVLIHQAEQLRKDADNLCYAITQDERYNSENSHLLSKKRQELLDKYEETLILAIQLLTLAVLNTKRW